MFDYQLADYGCQEFGFQNYWGILNPKILLTTFYIILYSYSIKNWLSSYNHFVNVYTVGVTWSWLMG
jgi:hypothetical protein